MRGPFDEYVLKARVAPLLFVALPPTAILAPLAADAVGAWAGPTALAVVVGLGLPAADAVARAGRRLQAGRWRSQGGSPTAKALMENSEVGRDRRQCVRAWLGLRIDPNDPATADRAGEVLRQKARAEPSPSRPVAVANADYGRARHLLVLRPLGLVTSATAAVLSVIAFLTQADGVVNDAVGSAQRLWAGVVFAGCVAATYLWWKFVTPESLDEADDLYTKRLMGFLDSQCPPSVG